MKRRIKKTIYSDIMSETTDFRSILEGLGYSLNDRGNEWRARPIFRESDSDTTLRISKKDGRWIDFARGNGGDFKKLVEISGGKFDGTVNIPKPTEKRVISDECFHKSEMENIVSDHRYWKGRGISEETLSAFRGGVIPKTTKSAMYGRYVFPIPNNREEFIGISGRWTGETISKNVPKWKHMGATDTWVYPAFLNKNEILTRKEIILVESIGDGLALWEAGIKHFLVLFGIRCGKSITKSLIAADPNRIIISTNNDSDNNFAGNIASNKIRMSLLEYFDPEQVIIKLPKKNDWGMTDKEDIIKVFI